MNERWVGKEGELNRLMRELALGNDNVLTTSDLLGLGMSPRMIQRRVSLGALVPIIKGAYALPGARLKLRGRCRAAIGSVGPRVVVSHASALALHGLETDPWVVHLTGESGVFRGHESGRWVSTNFGFRVVRHETRSLPPDQITAVNGIRATTIERSIRDYAASAKPAEINKVLTQGEKEASFCWGKLRRLVDSSNGHKGMGILSEEIEGWEEAFVDTSFDPEADFLLMLRDEQLPIPEVNVRLGSYVPDFLWRHLNLAVELDPYSTHKGMASHRQDHRKSIELEVSGLRVIRFTGEDLYQHRSRTGGEIRSIMEQQATLLHCSLFP